MTIIRNEVTKLESIIQPFEKPNIDANKAEAMLGVNDLFIKPVDVQELENKMSQLNSEQKEVFDKVLDAIEHNQQKHTDTVTIRTKKSLRLFTSGVAGK